MKRSTPAVHPHARGDNNLTVIGTPGWVGSPPRAWGQRARAPVTCSPLRFTPTRVGTTSGMAFGALPWSVHPHARGDNTNQVTDSPGRARGKGPLSHRCTEPYGPKCGL